MSIFPSSDSVLAEVPAAIVTLLPVVVKLLDNAKLPLSVIFLGPEPELIAKSPPVVVKLAEVLILPPNVIVLAVVPTAIFKELPVVTKLPARLISPLRDTLLGLFPVAIVISLPVVVNPPPKLRLPPIVMVLAEEPASIVTLFPVVIKSPPRDISRSASPVLNFKVLLSVRFEPAWITILWVLSLSFMLSPVLFTKTEPLRFNASDNVRGPLKTVAPETVRSPTISAEPAILRESLTCKSSLITVCCVVWPKKVPPPTLNVPLIIVVPPTFKLLFSVAAPATLNLSDITTVFKTLNVLFTLVAPDTLSAPAEVVEPLMLRLPSTCNKSLTLRFFVFHSVGIFIIYINIKKPKFILSLLTPA